MALDMQYVSDKAKEQEDARGEHVRKLLVELIDQIYRDFNAADRPVGLCARNDIIEIIERFVTKRRRWL